MLKKFVLLCLFSSYYLVAQANTSITSCEDLKNISQNLDEYYYLTNSIQCSDTFHPIDGTFTGTLDGQGFEISQLNIVNQDGRKSENTGLFRVLGQNAQVINIHFSYIQLTAHRDANRGFLAGMAIGDVNISNVKIFGHQILHHDVPADKKKDLGGTGGLVGLATGGTLNISDIWLSPAHLDLFIAQNAFAGGLVGIAEGNIAINNAEIWHLESKGSKECYNPANECGFGGLIGLIGKFEPHQHGNPPDTHVPTLEGGYSAIISQSSIRGTLFSDKNIGGMVGMIKSNRGVLIENSFTDVHIKCRGYDGSKCDIPSKYVGGLIGKAVEGSDQKMIELANVYVRGPIDVDDRETHSAAIVGYDQSPSSRISNLPFRQSYFDMNRTHKIRSGDNVSIGMTTDQMQAGRTLEFATWNPLFWSFREGLYPALRH